MSRSARDTAAQFFGALDARVRELPRRLKVQLSPNIQVADTLRPWICILGGLCFGLMGYYTVTREAQTAWLREHAAPKEVWESALRLRGFLPVTDERALFDAQSRLPLTGENSARVHVLASRRAILLKTGQERALYSLGSSRPPSFYREDWERLGYGWDAYENFLALELPAIEPPIFRVPSKKSIRGIRDPRELQY